jgi:hypothetical protein
VKATDVFLGAEGGEEIIFGCQGEGADTLCFKDVLACDVERGS